MLEDLQSFFPATLELALAALLLSVLVGVPLGVYSSRSVSCASRLHTGKRKS